MNFVDGIVRAAVGFGRSAWEEARAAVTLPGDVRRVQTAALLDRARRVLAQAEVQVNAARRDVSDMRATLAEMTTQRDQIARECAQLGATLNLEHTQRAYVAGFITAGGVPVHEAIKQMRQLLSAAPGEPLLRTVENAAARLRMLERRIRDLAAERAEMLATHDAAIARLHEALQREAQRAATDDEGGGK